MGYVGVGEVSSGDMESTIHTFPGKNLNSALSNPPVLKGTFQGKSLIFKMFTAIKCFKYHVSHYYYRYSYTHAHSFTHRESHIHSHT